MKINHNSLLFSIFLQFWLTGNKFFFDKTIIIFLYFEIFFIVKKLFIAWFYESLAQIDKKVHLKIINFNEVTKKNSGENIKEHYPNGPKIPDHPCRILIILSSVSGYKTYYLI